jgi:hypothetical protein
MDTDSRRQLEHIKRDDPYAFFLRNSGQLPYQSRKFYQLTFGEQVLETVHIFSIQPHDRDLIRANLTKTVETLFLALSRTGMSQIYSPSLLPEEYKKNPAEVAQSYNTTAQKILRLLAEHDTRSRIDELSDLLECVENFVEYTLQIGEFKTFEDMVMMSLEYKFCWANLKSERDEIIRRKPYLKFQLESESVFPLKFVLNEESQNFRELLMAGNVNRVPNYMLTLKELKNLLAKCVTNLIDNQGRSHSEVRNLMAKHIRSKDYEVDFSNLSSLLIPVLGSMGHALPSYVEAYQRSHISSYALRQMLSEETDEQGFISVPIPEPAPLDLSNKRQETPNVSTPVNNVSRVHVTTVESATPLKYYSPKNMKAKKKLVFNLSGESPYQEDENSPSAGARFIYTPNTNTCQPTMGILVDNSNIPQSQGQSRVVPNLTTPKSDQDLYDILGIPKRDIYSPITPY